MARIDPVKPPFKVSIALACLAAFGMLMPQLGCTRSRAQSAAPQSQHDEAAPVHAEGISLLPQGSCIAIQPLGEVPPEQIASVSGALGTLYGVEIHELEPADLPQSAWYEPRRRWRAERLLDFLTPLLPDDCHRILGMTTQDISTTKGEHEDWGILGLANMPGTAAVISFYRCRRRVADVPPLERLGRVAIHEIGHTLGLPHCSTFGCYMEDAAGTVETIDRETFLCDVCRERLGRMK